MSRHRNQTIHSEKSVQTWREAEKLHFSALLGLKKDHIEEGIWTGMPRALSEVEICYNTSSAESLQRHGLIPDPLPSVLMLS
jgi:hypothetical protein